MKMTFEGKLRTLWSFFNTDIEHWIVHLMQPRDLSYRLWAQEKIVAGTAPFWAWVEVLQGWKWGNSINRWWPWKACRP